MRVTVRFEFSDEARADIAEYNDLIYHVPIPKSGMATRPQLKAIIEQAWTEKNQAVINAVNYRRVLAP